MEMDVHSWAAAQDIIKKYSQSQALKADLVESAPRSQGHVVNQMSGSSGSAPRPASQSQGGQRKKYDTDNRGRDKTKAPAPPSNGEGQSPGRSKSGSRECWGCHEVVSGDHYQHNCPKQKKEDEIRLITPYPGRNRTSSRDRSGASQGNKTFRMFQGSFGTQPWKKDGEEAVSKSAAAAVEGSAPAPVAGSAHRTADTTPTTAPGEESSEEEEDLENEERARLEEEQLVWDETVKDECGYGTQVEKG